MKNLDDSVKRLVNEGRWSMYRIQPHGAITHWIHCPAVPKCCSVHPEGDKERSYFVDDEGNLITPEVEFKPEPLEVVRFPDLKLNDYFPIRL